MILLISGLFLTACGGSSTSTNNPDGGPSLTGSISLRWDIPATRVDGTFLPSSEVYGYKIYVTNSNGSYPARPLVNITDRRTKNYTLKGLSAGTYYIYVTTYDMNGDESPLSDPVSKTI